MTAPDDLTAGRDRADELLRHLAEDASAAEAFLAGLTEVRDLAFLGAGLTAIARAEGRRLPPAQRAQAATRQVHLGSLRDRSRTDVAGLRIWLLRAAEEVQLVRRLREAADRLAG
ncbi:hypothetical protein [Blastococcus sp. TF02A-26]|uniref:hypothetical protein n=1 Tax=Blastococcus sp. TF02A-26 TaxID=2250577 RepID=UPI000DEBADFC|nr:hypothetical protein [Blastococcus sp. TF02A-26]RBY86826.1 hypothetical protein DQ240_08460 [Blastococcus sp. TF02A-26]